VSDLALAELQALWESQARADPLWAILSDDAKRRRGWDLASFLATGEQFVASVLDRFTALGAPPVLGEALDFGCGVGRLTQPLAARFARATGIDISPTMIDGANALNRWGDRARYLVNTEPSLPMVGDDEIDFVMSFITLQHMQPTLAVGYLREFLRVLRPGGLLFFQLPSHRHLVDAQLGAGVGPLSLPACRARLILSPPPVEMSPRQTVELAVTVTNDSPTDWVADPAHPIRVGNHWLLADGATAVHDDGRAGLPGQLGAGATTTAKLLVTAPEEPGHYRLAVDVVQEGVRWFADAGSCVAEAPVQVPAVPAPPAAGAAAPGLRSADPLAPLIAPEWFEPPSFEMHGVPRAEVEVLLAAAGAEILDTDQRIDDWVSFGYYVRG